MSRLQELAREAVRQQRELERQQRNEERAAKARGREELARAKEAQRRHLQMGVERAAEDNVRLAKEISALEGILADGLKWKPRVNFQALLAPITFPPFE